MPVIVAPIRRVLSDTVRNFESVPVALGAQTATVEVRLRRPTTAAPRPWTAAGIVLVRLVLTVDGVRYTCEARTAGGIRSVFGTDADEFILRYTPPWGFFGARTGLPRRLGETAQSTYTAHVEVSRLADVIDTVLIVETAEAPAPSIPFRNPLAFDAASSAEAIAPASGALSWSHTATGSDRAVFVGAAHYEGPGASSYQITTYAGVNMTEIWDEITGQAAPNNDIAHQGNSLVAPTTGAQTVATDLTVAGSKDYLSGGAISMTGVHQTTPTGTSARASGTGTTASVTAADAVSGDLVVDSILGWTDSAGTLTIGANQTERNAQDWAPGNILRFKQSSQAGADGGVMSWTWTNPNPDVGWILGAIAFKPLAAAGATHPSWNWGGGGW